MHVDVGLGDEPFKVGNGTHVISFNFRPPSLLVFRAVLFFWAPCSSSRTQLLPPYNLDTMRLLSAFVTLCLAIFVVAIPARDNHKHPKTCKTTNAKLVLPAGQTNLTAPTGDPSFVLLGVGYQNYTCSASGRFT
jgi:hypothetical protein